MTDGKRANTSTSDKSPTKDRVLIIWLLVASALFVAAMLVYSAFKEEALTEAELLLFQVIIFGFGMMGSYIFGRASAAAAARDVIRPHAISAFRRVVSLYEALRRFVVTIEGQRERLLESAADKGLKEVPVEQVDAVLELFIIQITEQIGTANDAADDWRDIVPDEVKRVEEALRKRQIEERHGGT